MQRLPGTLAYHIVNLVAAVLVLAGLFIAVRGAIGGLQDIGALYESAGDPSLATPEVSEEVRSERMAGGAIGILRGVVCLSIGSAIFSVNHALSRGKRKARRNADALH